MHRGHGTKVSSKPSVLKAEQTEFSQPFLMWQVCQSSDHSHGPNQEEMIIGFSWHISIYAIFIKMIYFSDRASL